MGTMETLELQNEIKKIIGELGWSQNRLAREIYTATFDDDDLDEITKLEAILKKHLKRESTNPNRLLKYLKIISQHHEFQKLDIVLPIYLTNNSLSEVIQAGMMDISKEIDGMLTTEEH